jgi:glycosyltransferase involved in cell wall biosynthesis
MQQKKILIIVGTLETGGISTIASKISSYFFEKGYIIVIISLLDPIVEAHFDTNVVFYHFSNKKIKKHKIFYLFRWIQYIQKIINLEKPSCILAMTFRIGSMSVLANFKHHTRLIIREVINPKLQGINKLETFITDLICSHSNGIIFQTNVEKEIHSYRCQRIGKRIPNPVTVLLDADSNKINHIAYVGRLYNKQKNIDELIDAFFLANKKIPDLYLDIYGDGPDKQELVNRTAKLNLSNNIIFHGNTDNVCLFYKNFKAFVCSSSYEGMSNSLLEAWLTGVPCISSDWPGVSEIITNGVDGLIYPRGNTKSLSNDIISLVSNVKLANYLSTNARKNRSSFSNENILKQYFEFITSGN